MQTDSHYSINLILHRLLTGCHSSLRQVFNFVVGFSFLPLMDILGPGILSGLFASVCFVGVFYVQGFVLETTGKSFEEIEALLNG